MSIVQILGGGLLLRLGLIGYGEWQDRVMNLKYTDIDYSVFSDAATHVSQVSPPSYMVKNGRYIPPSLVSTNELPLIVLTALYCYLNVKRLEFGTSTRAGKQS